MIINQWVSNGPAKGGTDGHCYRLCEFGSGLSLESIDVTDFGDDTQIVEVETAAFDNLRDLSAFAAEVGALLECQPHTIIKAMS